MTQGLTRRGLMAAAGAVAIAPAAAPAFAAEPSLNDLARANGRFFGSAVGAGDAGVTASLGDPTYRRLLTRECGLLVCENEMKWYVLRPDPQTFDFSRADRIADFARENGMDLRGHTLLWHHPQWFPAWVATHDFGPQPATAAEAMVVDHIQRVAGRYPRPGRRASRQRLEQSRARGRRPVRSGGPSRRWATTSTCATSRAGPPCC